MGDAGSARPWRRFDDRICHRSTATNAESALAVGAPLSAWLVAFSLIGLDNLTDPIFRLPCRAIDPGCTGAVVTATFADMMHLLIGMVTGSLTLVAPFALSRRMRLCSNWRDLASKTDVFGVALTILFVVYVGLNGAYGQRLRAAHYGVAARCWDSGSRSTGGCDGTLGCET